MANSNNYFQDYEQLLNKFVDYQEAGFGFPTKLNDTQVGFSLRKDYPIDINYKPALSKNGTPDDVAIIWVVYDPQRTYESNPNLVLVRCRVANISLYRLKNWDYNFDDDNCPTRESVEFSLKTPKPYSLDFPNDYFFDHTDNSFVDANLNPISGVTMLNQIFTEHCNSIHPIRGIKYKYQTLTSKIKEWLYNYSILVLRVLLKKLFGRTIEENIDKNNYLNGYSNGDFKKLQLDSIELVGYRASKPVILIFCTIVVIGAFFLLPPNQGGYLSSLLDSEFLTAVHGIILLIILDELIPTILFNVMNLIIRFRKYRLLRKIST